MIEVTTTTTTTMMMMMMMTMTMTMTMTMMMVILNSDSVAHMRVEPLGVVIIFAFICPPPFQRCISIDDGGVDDDGCNGDDDFGDCDDDNDR